MPISLAENITIDCPTCRLPFDANVWLIVNVVERPDLLNRICADMLHNLTCPHCRQDVGQLDAPLLVYRPDADPPIIFSPAQQTTEEQDEQQAISLLSELQERLGDAWQDAWLTQGLFGVQRAIVSSMLSHEAEQALSTQEEQAWADLKDLRERAPQVYRHSEVDERMSHPQEQPSMGTNIGQLHRLASPAQILEQFIQARTWLDSYRHVLAHPGLFEEDALALLEENITAYGKEGNALVAQMLEEHRDLLHRCIAVGATAAFAEKFNISPQDLEALDRAEIPPDVATILAALDRPENQYNLLRRIELCRQALTLVAREQNPTLWATLYDTLGTSLIDSPLEDRATNVEQAIVAYRQAIEVLTRRDRPIEWAQTTMNLASAYQSRILGDRAANLELAINLYEQALQVQTREAVPVEWAITTMGLATAYWERIRGERAANLELAINLYEQALQVQTREALPAAWAMTTVNLANTYASRILGDRAANIERAIDLYEQALVVLTRGAMPVEWAQTTTGLANAYWERIRGERAANIERAINLYEQALKVRTRAAMPIEWAQTMMNLATAYANRIRGERAANVERTIGLYEQTLEVLTRDAMPVEWGIVTMNLASAYQNRIYGERTENLERAMDLFQQALEVLTRDTKPIDWAQIMNNLANVYGERIRGKRAENIERAISLYEQALQVQTREALPIEWAQTTMNLAIAYQQRIHYERADNLERAINLFEQVLEVQTREALPIEWATTTMNLANTYRERIRGERAANLEHAIALYEQTLEVRTRLALPVEWATTTANLANVYRERICGERAKNLARAFALYEQALHILKPTTLPVECRMAARNLGSLCFDERRWQEASHAYALALEAMETLYQSALSRSGKDDELTENSYLFRHAAYALARSNNLRGAAVMLERGRARGLSEILTRDRTDLAELQHERAEVYGQFIDAAARMRQSEAAERGAFQMVDHAAPQLLPAELRTQAERARTDLEATVERIRAIPGHEAFLTLPDWDDIATAVQPTQPLVYLVTTSAGSLALMVQRAELSTDLAITPVWLDDFTSSELRELLFGPADAPALAGWLDTYNRRRVDWQRWFDTLEQVTGQLWDMIMGPVIAQLQMTGARRAILIPTGLLALLPLHAARISEGEQRTYALDQLTLSYAPSARVLTIARRTAATIPADRLLAVDEPQPVSANRLPGSQAEVIAIADLFDTPQVLRHTAATRQTVLYALPQAQVAHFSCHGGTDWTNPLHSGLLLASDEVLTVQDLFGLHLDGARLATLSACETGIVGTKLPDEVVALPSAFLRAGFAGVAASLWSVADLSTAMLMARFYHLWHRDGLEPAEALRQAQFWLRDTTNGEKRQYFEQFLPEFSPDALAARLPVAVADVFYKVVALADDAARDFAHPFHWAAFQYVGV